MTATHNFSMVRGDTLSFDVRLSDLDGATIASLYFTAKKKATDEEFIFQKSLTDGITKMDDTTYRVRVAPEDTDGVAAGRYVYDLQVGVGSDIYTLLMGGLTIVQDVTEER